MSVTDYVHRILALETELFKLRGAHDQALRHLEAEQKLTMHWIHKATVAWDELDELRFNRGSLWRRLWRAVRP